MTRARTFDVGLWAMIAFLGGLYAWSGPRALPDMDAAEFLVIASKGGIAHPPGYPLLSALFQVVASLVGNSSVLPALALTVAAFNVGASVLVYRVNLEMTKARGPALVATIVVFTAYPVWRAAGAIEPFSLNLLLAGVCLWSLWRVLLSESPRTQNLYAGLLGLSFGLSFCNHHSMAFLLPSALAGLGFAGATFWRRLSWFAVGSALGLVPLAYFAFNTQGGYVWGDWAQFWPRLLTHLFRLEYGTVTLAPGTKGEFWTGPWLFVQTAAVAFSLVWLAVALYGVVRGLSGGSGPETSPANAQARWRFLVLVAVGVVMTGGVFPLLFRVEAEAGFIGVVERFFSLPLVWLSPFVAIGAASLVRWFFHRWVMWGVTAVLVVAQVLLNYSEAERTSETFFEDHVQNVVRVAGENSLIITQSDMGYMGLLYATEMMEEGEKITFIQKGLWHLPWYYRRKAARLGVSLEKGRTLQHLVEKAAKRYNVYLLAEELGRGAPHLQSSYPIGPLIRLLPEGERPPGPRKLFRMNARLYRQSLHLPEPGDMQGFKFWEKALITSYGRPWRVLAREFEKGGGAQQNEYLKVCRTYQKYFAVSGAAVASPLF